LVLVVAELPMSTTLKCFACGSDDLEVTEVALNRIVWSVCRACGYASPVVDRQEEPPYGQDLRNRVREAHPKKKAD
jgi:hypothetical protein